MKSDREIMHNNRRLAMFDGLLALASIAGRLNDPRIKFALYMISSLKDVTRAAKIYNRTAAMLRLSPGYVAAATCDYPFKSPPAGIVAGEIRLGNAFNPATNCNYPVGLMISEMLQHTQIIGRSGAGKTTLIIFILIQFMLLKIAFWLFDFKKDYRPLIRQGNVFVLRWSDSFKFNPFLPPPGTDFVSWLIIVRDVLFDIFFPQYSAESTKAVFFETALHLYRKNGKLNIYDLMDEFRRKMNDRSVHSSTKERIRTLLNRLDPMMHILGNLFDCEEGHPLPFLMENPVILELDGLGTDYQNLLANLISQWMFLYRMNNNQRNKVFSFIVIDESHRLLSGNNRFIQDFIRLSREFGLGLLYANQTLDLDNCVLANTYTIIALSITSSKDRNQMAYNLNLTPEQCQVLSSLKMRHAIIRMAGRYPSPYMFILPELKVDKSVSDEEVKQYMGVKLADLSYKARQNDKFNVLSSSGNPAGQSEPQSRNNESSAGVCKKHEEVLSRDEKYFFNDVCKYGFICSTERSSRLGWTSYRVNRVSKSLVSKVLLEVVEIGFGFPGRPPKYFKTTAAGETISKQEKGKGRGDFEHRLIQYCLKEYAVLLIPECQATIEEPCPDRTAFADVGITLQKSDRKAFEVVTSNVFKEADNLIGDINSGYWGEVVFFCLTQGLLDGVKEECFSKAAKYTDRAKFYLVSDIYRYLLGLKG